MNKINYGTRFSIITIIFAIMIIFGSLLTDYFSIHSLTLALIMIIFSVIIITNDNLGIIFAGCLLFFHFISLVIFIIWGLYLVFTTDAKLIASLSTIPWILFFGYLIYIGLKYMKSSKTIN